MSRNATVESIMAHSNMKSLARKWDLVAAEDSSVSGSSPECTLVLLWNMDSVLLPHSAACAVQPALLVQHVWHK